MARAAASAGIDSISGTYQGIVAVNSRTGLVIRSKPRYRRPTTDAQRACAERLKIVTTFWTELNREHAQLWNEFAQRFPRQNPVNGKVYRATGYNTYTALALKVLQVDPEATVPSMPPAEAYPGPGLGIVARSAPGGIEFEASEATPAGTVVEVMAERLANDRRSPTNRLTTLGFVAFESDSLAVLVPVSPGYYWVAYQFVNVATGQVAGYRTVGFVEV